MKSQAYFEKIHLQIEKQLNLSTESIRLAIAWLTNEKLFKILCNKAKEGILVELIMANNEINYGSSINFSELEHCGGKLYWAGKEGRFAPLMHNKFCIIDNNILIFGSYNWTQKAKSNHESITVIEDDPNLILDFNQEFDKIKNKYYQNEDSKVDWLKIIIRLETLLNVIRLEDEEDINYQTTKIKGLLPKNSIDKKVAEVNSLLALCNKKKYTDAVKNILIITSEYKKIIIYQDPEIPALQLEIRSLEFQVSSLEDEKIEIEKNINRFSLKYNLEFGEILERILFLKKIMAKKFADENKDNTEKQQQYYEAKEDYEDFSKTYQENLKKEKPAELNENQLKELKQNYRKATKLCHPDKVTDEQKEMAQKVFTDLKDAYDRNDLEKVNRILSDLEKGFFKSQGETINVKEKLHLIKQQLETRRKELEETLTYLKNTEIHQKVENINNWDDYFIETKQKFTLILEELEEKQINYEESR